MKLSRRKNIELALERWAEDYNEKYAEVLAMRALAKAMAATNKEVK